MHRHGLTMATFGAQTTPIPLLLAAGADVRGPISVGSGGAVTIGSGGAGYYSISAAIRFQGSTTGAAMPIQTVGLYKNGGILVPVWPDFSVVNAHTVSLSAVNVQVADGDSFSFQFQGGNGLRCLGSSSNYSFQRGV